MCHHMPNPRQPDPTDEEFEQGYVEATEQLLIGGVWCKRCPECHTFIETSKFGRVRCPICNLILPELKNVRTEDAETDTGQ